MRTIVIGCLATILAALDPAYAVDPIPRIGGEEAPASPLPRLEAPIVPDGALDEWAAAVRVPVRTRGEICAVQRGHAWHGPADASMEAFCGWRPEGLCLAARVTDDDIRNDRPVGRFWEQDCVELFVDGRSGAAFMSAGYGPGVLQLLVAPPVASRDAGLYAADDRTPTGAIQLGAARAEAGYVIEVLIPWDVLPGFAPIPGAEVALQFGFDDSDARDGDRVQPLQMTRYGARDLFSSPHRFIRWVLVEEMPRGRDVWLDPAVSVQTPSILRRGAATSFGAWFGSNLAATTRRVRFTATGTDGDLLFEETVSADPVDTPWGAAGQAEILASLRAAPANGVCDFRVELLGDRDEVLGRGGRRLYCVAHTVDETIAAIRRADVPGLASRDPFRAAAYAGLGSCIERVKRGVELDDVDTTVWAQWETSARFDVLESGRVPEDAPGLLDLLTLAAHPDAQVAVGFRHDERRAGVLFAWGAFPLASVTVVEYPDDAAAEAAFGGGGPGWFVPLEEFGTLDGLPLRVRLSQYGRTAFDLNDYAPAAQVLLLEPGSSRQPYVIQVADLPRLRPAAACLLSGCPERVAAAVRSWAAEKNVPTVEPTEAARQPSVIVAGDIRHASAADLPAAQGGPTYRLHFSDTFATAAAVKGRRVLSVRHPYREVAEAALRLVAAGEPVTVVDANAIRVALVAAAGWDPEGDGIGDAGSLDPEEVFCGDVHMHTFYSDGRTSPVSLALQAVYSGLDFAVLSDHNTIEGALVQQKLFADHRFAYPLTVGEELTMGWSHFNAYPLREVVDWNGSAYEIIRAAHVQGAVVQWNHPGWPASDWGVDHYASWFDDTALDAWEHYAPIFPMWESNGRLPTVVGSTDTHDGNFDNAERTAILAPSAEGPDLAEAVRGGRAGLVTIHGDRYLYGPAPVVRAVSALLVEGDRLRETKADRIRAYFAEADLAGLIDASPPRSARLSEIAAAAGDDGEDVAPDHVVGGAR